MAFIEDPRKSVKERMGEITRQEPAMDAKELAEREEAAKAYAGENEKHFVEYLEDCVATSMNANEEVREVQDECWDLWNEKEPPNYANKESWQSRVVLPMPHSSVLFAMSLIRKAFDVQFLNIENERNQPVADFNKKLMTIQLSRPFSNFPLQFSDACGMSCAVGTSMEMIPIYRKGKGLKYPPYRAVENLPGPGRRFSGTSIGPLLDPFRVPGLLAAKRRSEEGALSEHWRICPWYPGRNHRRQADDQRGGV